MIVKFWGTLTLHKNVDWDVRGIKKTEYQMSGKTEMFMGENFVSFSSLSRASKAWIVNLVFTMNMLYYVSYDEKIVLIVIWKILFVLSI